MIKRLVAIVMIAVAVVLGAAGVAYADPTSSPDPSEIAG